VVERTRNVSAVLPLVREGMKNGALYFCKDYNYLVEISVTISKSGLVAVFFL
jgi:hypothetical protein